VIRVLLNASKISLPRTTTVLIMLQMLQTRLAATLHAKGGKKRCSLVIMGYRQLSIKSSAQNGAKGLRRLRVNSMRETARAMVEAASGARLQR
jgi:hypothetical protein